MDERWYLGCVVSTRGEAYDSFPVESAAFYEPLNREIFGHIKAIHGAGGKISADSIVSRMGPRATEIGIFEIEAICFYPSAAMTSQFQGTLLEKLALRRAKALGESILYTVDAAEDPREFCADIAKQAASLLPDSKCENQRDIACAELDERLIKLETGTHEIGFPTPLDAWNGAFGGICPGNLYALAARPGAGKTALMEQMAAHYLMDDRPVLIFEKDMSPRMLVERMVCRLARVPYWKLARGIICREEIEEVRRMNAAMKKSALLLYNPTGLTAEKMSAITRREARVSKIEAVFLDHIQVLNVGKETREGLTRASITIRQTVTETNIPHVILTHINRNGAKGRPTPEDIKEFDQLFGDCDGMGIIWTEADKTKLKGDDMLPMKLYFAKNRNGPVGENDILFDGKLMAFRNPEKTQ